MTSSSTSEKTRVDALVNAGEGQTEAVAITDFVYMAKDVSNCYLITSEEGNVLINAGTSAGAQRTKNLFAAVSPLPTRYVIVTQSHGDHYGGLATLMPEGAELVVSSRYLQGVKERQMLSGFLVPRTNKLWHHVIGTRMDRSSKPRPVFTPTVQIKEHFSFSLGGRNIEVLGIPGGESLDGLAVWLPKEKIVFTGNLFGPAYLNVPNLNTLRGDRIRSAQTYIASLNTILDLKPELLITGHSHIIRGNKQISADILRMRDGMQSVLDQTIAGMNAGKDIHTLMAEVKMPANYRLEEAYGKTIWNVKAIWEEYSGWFFYDSTTSLYAVPRGSVSNDLVELAGGAEKLVQRAQEHLNAAQPLKALHLLDIVLDTVTDFGAAKQVKRSALVLLLDQSGSVNLNETMWLKSEIAALDAPYA